ncbi:MAG: hypothetical protein GYB31_10425 [Bacteroidetes bacterium]|nr:hypothetical protein [Bacteroidota bacterium]
MVLEETRKATKKNPANFNVADYWNICTVFLNLKMPRENLELAFRKMLLADGSCEYLSSLKDDTKLDEALPVLYQQSLNKCEAQGNLQQKVDPVAYARENRLDPALIRALAEIQEKDQRYRDKPTEQAVLDRENQISIEALFEKHQTYIGKSLAGEEFSYVMWMVIQHSNIPMMERYLPVLHTAVKEGELEPNTLKLTIDRIYAGKYDYQIFGSQFGVPMAPEDIIHKVKKEFGI